jgi:hypothetical protein
MVDPQKPIVGIGSQLSIGTVTAILSNKVLVDTAEGIKEFSLLSRQREEERPSPSDRRQGQELHRS